MKKISVIIPLLIIILFSQRTILSTLVFHAEAQTTVTNLITNGGFESDFTGWNNSGDTITTTVHSGSKAAHAGGAISRHITGSPGKTYKVTFWMKMNSSTTCSGDCWGWFNAHLDNWNGLTGTTNSTLAYPGIVPLNQWTKQSFEFTVGSTTGGDLVIGPFAGAGWHWDVDIDDVMFFEKPTTPISPTVSIQASTTSLSTIPGTVNFSSTFDDIDGSIPYLFWDFGDGGHSNDANPQHSYINNGTYIAKLTVYDDSGLSATSQTTITVNDPTYPTVTISAPTQTTISSPSLSITGSATGTISRVEWSTDRGLKGTASGTTNWNFSLDLTNYSGKNRITINAYDSAGKLARNDIIINYLPSTKVAILNGSNGVTQNSQSVELWDKFEATFSLQNSLATNPNIPYVTGLPAGMVSVNALGVSVDGIFTSPTGKVFTQPGFFYQPYTRNTNNKTLIAQGAPVWKIRFSPTEKGAWFYQIRVTDASGTTTLSDPSKLNFNTVTPTNPQNHGFIHVSPTDKRYFEFSDGTPFIGVGPGAILQGDSFSNEQMINKVGVGSGNYSRTWISGNGIAGSSWVPWGGGLDYDGNVAGNSLTTDEAYGDSQYSLTLPDVRNPSHLCAFYGFQGINASIKSNTNYRVFLRLKTVGITGTGGFTFRPGVNWPNTCNDNAGVMPVIPYQKGTTDWHVVTATWNSGNRNILGDSLITLENVTAGRVYIDEISLREDLGNGQYGPEVLPRSKVNVQDYFGQEASYDLDLGLDQQATKGQYEKFVIAEKQDYSYSHISPYGYGYANGGLMGDMTGASGKYQQFYWRYLIARFGYSRAVHSWEYANEQAPGALLEARTLASYMHSYDPNKHMGVQSPWCCTDTGHTYDWGEIDFADSHSYVNAQSDNTSWLNGTTFPVTWSGNTIPSYTSLGNDTALYVLAHSMDAWTKNVAGNKPMDVGEVGIGQGSITAGNNDTDTQGVWLHQFLWAQVNPGALYFIYWYNQTIDSRPLYPLYTMYRKFMEGSASDTINKRIPLNNGKYQDIQLTLPTGIYGWGQKDVTNGGAHFWMYDKLYTWTTPTGGYSIASKQVSFTGLPAKSYIIEFWDTWTGTVTTQNLNFTGGTMTLTIPANFTQKDIAVKVIPTTGYLEPNPTTQPIQADINHDGTVDLTDLKLTFPIYASSTTCQTFSCDTNGDGKVNMYDAVLILKTI